LDKDFWVELTGSGGID